LETSKSTQWGGGPAYFGYNGREFLFRVENTPLIVVLIEYHAEKQWMMVKT
jgi:hypothetical protein